MSASVTVKFDYADINDAQGYVDKLVSSWWGEGYNFYETAMDTSIKGSLTGGWLEASSPYGASYVEDAASNVGDKCSALTTMAGKWQTVSKNLGNYVQFLKDTDDKVQGIFDTLSAGYVDYSGFWGKCQWVEDGLYNLFSVDLVNWNAVTRMANNIDKLGQSHMDELLQDAKEWFQHGTGKYVLNIIGNVVGVGLAVIGTVAAFLAIPFSGGTSSAIALGCIAFAASGISTIITMWNGMVSNRQNYEALQKHEEDAGSARFYGNISGVSDWVYKNDLGSEFVNDICELGATGLDRLKATADVTAFVTGALQTLGTKMITNGDEIVGVALDFDKENVVNNLFKTFGVKREHLVPDTDVFKHENIITFETNYVNNQIATADMTSEFLVGEAALKANATDVTVSSLGNRTILVDSVKTYTDYSVVASGDGVNMLKMEQFNQHIHSSSIKYDFSGITEISKIDKAPGTVQMDNLLSFFGDEGKALAFNKGLNAANLGFKAVKTGLPIMKEEAEVGESVIDFQLSRMKGVSAFNNYLKPVPLELDENITLFLPYGKGMENYIKMEKADYKFLKEIGELVD